MITQKEAEDLIAKAKIAIRNEVFSWAANTRYDESVVALGDDNLQFVLSLSQNPFEIKAHFRTKKQNIQLARIDNHKQHINPDGKRIVGPHLHWYKEGYMHLEWAEEIDWYDTNKLLETIYKFLDLIQTKFPKGIQGTLI